MKFAQLLIGLAAILSAPALADTHGPITFAEGDPRVEPAAILPLESRADIIDARLANRLNTLIPKLMREEGIAMWVIMAREYFEEPVIATMLDAKSFNARRRTILVFFDPGAGEDIERLTVSRYGLAGLFEPAWEPDEQPDQWAALADIIAARDPANIAINVSATTRFADGMTKSQYDAMMTALAPEYRERIVSGERLAVRWLETRTSEEVVQYRALVALAHQLISEAMSRKVITPGVTTTREVQWWYRKRIQDLGITPWFHPSFGLQREGEEGILSGDTVIMPGDLLWTDLGLTYLRLNTDNQHLGYVLKPGETEVPAGLQQGLTNSNRVQDILISHMRTGLSGNEILARARAEAIAEGLDPSIYSHPIGFHGHGAGTAIGFWDNQEADPRGEDTLRANTAWAIELTSYSAVPEWGGQRVDFRTEEDAFFDGESVRFLHGRQTAITMIPSD
ncbi:M24 family metallopeptidase [Erythrobacter sp. SCSIO 43205]|uniref:M24 family metallopeptidase n=1 Tax=Erythrobacter sp. SCSIO 43205 TaxID=2779361 RepID=UPI001CA7D501|nr:M24 family metallopeptidase [Erythrobacter sp. SCSIO 43205]UAB76844.1 M24 family metallopeptidase [Erythrobacter sp. SCSIO 43205]